MASIDRYYQAEYKFCAMNGAPLNRCIRGSLTYDLKTMTFTVEELATNEDGLFMTDNFAHIVSNGKYPPEPITETITRPIIALPHEIRDMK